MLQEFEYNGDKIVQHGEHDFYGYYFNADEDIEEVRGTTFDEVCRKLDEYNAIVAEIKKDEGYE